MGTLCYKQCVAFSHINIINNLLNRAIPVKLLNYMGKEVFHERT
jgi:hypothetical protein